MKIRYIALVAVIALITAFIMNRKAPVSQKTEPVATQPSHTTPNPQPAGEGTVLAVRAEMGSFPK